MRADLYAQMHRIEDHHWWFRARRAIVQSLLDHLGQQRAGAVLDLGCGTGGNLPLLANYGAVYGVDASDEAVTMASARGIGEIYPGRLPDRLPDRLELPELGYGLVTLFDVLEHIEDDHAALQRAAALLGQGGRLVITVPACRFLWSEHDRSHHHFRRYSRRQLQSLIDEAGLSCDYIGYYNTLLFPLVASMRLFKRLSGMQGDEERMPPGWLNRLLLQIMAAERFLLPHVSLPFGVSLIAICRNRSPDVAGS